jgi:hypothetical protein
VKPSGYKQRAGRCAVAWPHRRMSRHRRRGQRLPSRRGGPSSFPLGIDDITTAGVPRGSENEKCTAYSASLARCRSMSLRAQLEAWRREYERTPNRARLMLCSARSKRSQKQASSPRQTAPLFELRCGRGGFIDLSDLLNRGPVVISFFWGDSCPFCVLELNALAAAHPEIERLGATSRFLAACAR